jgi:hypothetical protein
MNLKAFCHTKESLEMLPEEHRAIVLKLAESALPDLYKSPYMARNTFSSTLARVGISVPDDIFKNLEKDDSIEMWTNDFRFIFAMGHILEQTSYQINELACSPWHLLFARSELENARILSKFHTALENNQSQISVTNWHTVTELASSGKFSFEVRVDQITPFVSSRGFNGIIARVKSRPLPSA